VKVLVVDDEPDVLLLCRVNMEFAGHQVLEASDAIIGMEMALAQSPDLIVLDIMLPGKDGVEMLRDLRADPRTFNIPVILLTAKTQHDDVMGGYDAGADDYMTKPFSPAVLMNSIEQVLRMSPEERVARRRKALGLDQSP
jgi:DNA-binding response OmpR family regulator